MRNILRLHRAKNPHTRVITAIKSALRRSSEEDVLQELSVWGRGVGLPTPTTQELGQIITGRLHNTLTHSDATTRLATLAHSHPTTHLTPDTWLTLENLARSIGCFHASHHFTTHATTAINNTPHPPHTRFLTHLHQQNLPDATTCYNTLPPRKKHHPFWKDAGHYLWHWTSGQHGTPHHDTSTWTPLITGHHITILGPAPTQHTPPPHNTPHLTARVIMQNVLKWEASNDPFGGACDLAYANRETRNWLLENRPMEKLQQFRALSFREDGRSDKWRQLGLSTARVAHDPRALMLSGSSPNMVPLMVWDLLSVPDVTVTIAGTTFFATQQAYSPDNRRFKHSLGKNTDETGSTGGLFERCPTFARHNVVDNLSLVANLVHSGSVGIDPEGQAIVELSIPDYLHRLDELYGRERR